MNRTGRGRRARQYGRSTPVRLAATVITLLLLAWLLFSALYTRSARQSAVDEAENEIRAHREAIAAARDRAMAEVDAIADDVASPALLACIRAAMADIAGATRGTDPTRLDGLDDLLRLRCPEDGIRRLDGLQHLTRLKHLELRGNAIRELAPLRALAHLETLGLEGNPLGDLTPLAYHPALRHVSLGRSVVEKLDPVLTIPNLSSLGLPGGIEIACEDARTDAAALDIELDGDPDDIACPGL